MASNTHLTGDQSAKATVPPAVPLAAKADVLAPDGSEVRILSRTHRASMASFRLAPGQVTVGVVHRTVDEVWYVTGGEGLIWRCFPPDGTAVEDRLVPGVSVAIPVGTHFQFRAAEDATLDILGVTVPAWPGEEEAVPSEIAPWKPNL